MLYSIRILGNRTFLILIQNNNCEETEIMLNPKKIEEFADKFSQSIPPGAKTFQKDIEKSFKDVLQSLVAKMDLVTREEFDVQQKVLSRTREKIENLEKIVSELEKRQGD